VRWQRPEVGGLEGLFPAMRSKLFVPGTRPAWFAQALASDADAVSIDLEDSVNSADKAAAREHVAAFLRSSAARAAGARILVRSNPVDSPHFEADVQAVVGTGVVLLNLPKPQNAGDVRRAAAVVERAEAAAKATTPIRLLCNIETPAALRLALEIASAHPRVAGLQLGLADLFEPLGIARDNAAAVQAVMWQVRLAAGEAGVWACDSAYPKLDDEAGFKAEARMARALGFVGKSCIHPRQVAWANAVFTQGAEEQAYARRVVAAQGQGAVQVDGRMVDAPAVQAASALLAAAEDSRSSGSR
jgi:citrate lyase beta subunit